MRYGIIGAMPEETDQILHQIEVRETREIGKRRYTIGTWHGHEVVLVFSRWGKVAAASTVTTLLDLFQVDQILFTGVAGGADPALEIGDVVISSSLVQHDLDASPVPGIKKFEVPLLGITHFSVRSDLVSQAEQGAQRYLATGVHEHRSDLDALGIRSPRIYTGLIASGDQFIASSEKLAQLRSELPELRCVEMEGAAVAQICHERSIPFVVIRTISDKADHQATLDFPKFIEKIARHFSAGIVENILTSTPNSNE